jgi:hypothetical protein
MLNVTHLPKKNGRVAPYIHFVYTL